MPTTRPYAIAKIRYQEEGDKTVTIELDSSLAVEEFINTAEQDNSTALEYSIYVLTMARTCRRVWTPEEVNEHALATGT